MVGLLSLMHRIGTLSKNEDEGSENDGKIMNLRSFKLNRSLRSRRLTQAPATQSNLIVSIWIRSICQMQATFPGVEFSRILFRLKKIKGNLSYYVHVLHKASN